MASQAMKQSWLRRLIIALAGTDAGNGVASMIENGNAISAASAFAVPAAIVAAHTSTTTDFAALAVGDLVAHIPATAGNSQLLTVVTAGTLPIAAVVGDLYLVIRAYAAPAAHAFKL